MDELFADAVRELNFQLENLLEVMEVAPVVVEEETELVEADPVDAKTAAMNVEIGDISLVIADVEDVAGNFHRLVFFPEVTSIEQVVASPITAKSGGT